MVKDIERRFTEDLEKNQNIIHKVCRAYTTSDDAHKDLFQEITIQLWRAYPKFRGEAKFSTWTYRVALNTAISLYRKSKRLIATSEINDHLNELEFKEYDTAKEEQIDSLYHAIRQLSDIEKALCLLYLDDKSYKEIAETLGITEVNARVKMNRTKLKLKELLNV